MKLKRFSSTKKALLLAFFALLAIGFNFRAQAEPYNSRENALELGLRLETAFWNEVLLNQKEEYSSKLSSIFQGIVLYQIYSREEYIDYLADLSLSQFQITNPVANLYGDVLVYSYDLIQTVGGIEFNPVPSVSVWQFVKREASAAERDYKDDSSSSSGGHRKHKRKNKVNKIDRGRWEMVNHGSGLSFTPIPIPG